MLLLLLVICRLPALSNTIMHIGTKEEIGT